MKISKYIDDYAFNKDLSVKGALQKIENSNLQILFVTDNHGHLKGVVADGDIRRWLLCAEDTNLDTPIKYLLKETYISASTDQNPIEISKLLNSKIRSIPIVDKKGVLVAVAESKEIDFKIEGRKISNKDPAFIIAEIGNNHQGSIDMAKELVDACIETEVDCIKFQMRTISTLYENKGNSSDVSADLGDQYTLDLLSKFQLSDIELFEVFDYCKQKGGIPLCTPWDLESLRKLEEYGMPAYKIASADFTNFELLEAVAKTHKPFFCSTGMSTEQEIIHSANFLKDLGSQCVFLHCNSTYPTPFKDVNLGYLDRLKSITQSLIGYSGHERGINIPIAAVSLGAKVIEKHITLDKSLEGTDHKVSLTPAEFNLMVKNIRQVEESMGNDAPREITQGELLNREVLAKSLVAKCQISEGMVIKREMVSVKSPGKGLQPNKLNELIGKYSQRDMNQGDFFYGSDLKEKIIIKETYNFNRPYGIPVRYHDFKELSNKVSLDFVEFHLSYQDLNEEPRNHIPPQDELSFTVHTPELFKGDHILDLCSFDKDYRETSINNLNKVIQHIKQLKPLFRSSKKPLLVLNAGGWNQDGFISKEDKSKKYRLVEESLDKINLESVALSIQTMPPFPWHFGGQSFHNLFVNPDEIDEFCLKTGHKICLDVSHTAMACSYYGWDLIKFVSKISKHINYLHVVDALGSDGEGVEIGEGDVNFALLSKILNKQVPNAPFIPEVWQGHKNSGEGFWNALNYLEEVF